MKQSAQLELVLFGHAQIMLDGVPVTGFVSAKAKALFCFLAITRRIQSRNALVALFWGDVPEADARSQLRIALSNLRKLVGDYLLVERESVVFDTAQNYSLDVQEFQQQLAAARALNANDAGAGVLHLQNAMRLYQGDLLEQMQVRDAPEFEEWLVVERERLRAMALDALWSVTRLARAGGRPDAAQDALKRILELEPWSEEAHREVMLWLARAGKRSAALRQYEICRAVLAQELNVEPAGETVQLYERIRAAGNAPRENLVAPSTLFIGREVELQNIAQRLEAGTRLITLLGPGGIGKTRLALQAASQQRDQFLNGVFFASLAQVTGSDGMVLAIAGAIGLTFSGTEAARTQLLNYLREKEMLLVLDNTEVASSAGTLVQEILTAAPLVRVLVTTRARLNLRAEWLIVVEGLPVSAHTLDAQTPSAAEQLFAARAAQVAPDFVLEREAAAVRQICALIEGMPLAIELAATWRRMLSSVEIAQQVQNDLDFLATTQPDIPPAHASMRAVFEHSRQLLSASEQEAFRNLALFHRGFTADAARRVAGVSPRDFNSLADKSFVRALPRIHSGDSLRFGMHELLRQFGYEELTRAADVHDSLSAQHAWYYARALAAQEQNLQGAAVKQAAAILYEDYDNIAAAWNWACAQRTPDAAVLSLMAGAVVFFMENRAQYRAGRQMYAHAIECVQAAGVSDAAAEILLARLCAGAGWFCFRLAEFEQGRSWSKRALELLRKHEADDFTAYPLLFMGANEFGMGNLNAALDWTEQSVQVFRNLNDAFGISGTLNNLGQISMSLGELDAAQNHLRMALEIARRAGIKSLQCNVLENLGALLFKRGALEQAERDLQECLALAYELDSEYEIATTQSTLAGVLYARGETAQATALIQEAELIWRRVGDRWSLCRALNQAAGFASGAGNDAQADKLFVSALELADAAGATTLALNALAGLAELRVRRGDIASAQTWLALVAQHQATEGQTRELAAQRLQTLTPALDAREIELLHARASPETFSQLVKQILEGGA